MFSANNKWLTFSIVACGVFMSTLDSSMVNIALPSIMAEFDSSLKDTEWVVMIYLLTITASLLFWGHLSDRLGRGKIYTTGLFSFGLASFFCATATQLSTLILFRFLQALGAAMMMSTGPAIIKETFPKEQLGRGLGLIGVAVSLGLMSGPSLGGILLELYSWRSLFFLTVPLGIVCALFGLKLLPGPSHHYTSPLDWLGGACWAVALTLFAVALSLAASPDRSLVTILSLLVVAAVFLTLFIKIEGKMAYPLLQVQLFSQRFFSMASIAAVLSFLVLFSVILLMPFYLDRILTLPPSRIGLVMLAIPATILVIAPLAGWLSDHADSRILTTMGLSISTCGVFMLTTLTSETTPHQVALRLALLGCGQAMFLSPNSHSILSRVAKEHAGAAAALLATARNLGMLLGIAQAALVFSLTFGALTGGLDLRDFSLPLADHFLTALKKTFQVAGVIGIIGACCSILRGNHHRH